MQPVTDSSRGRTRVSTLPDASYARRVHAYNVGEAKARRREISADAYLFLYKELVGLAGDRAYCWPGLNFLVRALDTSVGTVKRWMRELEQADLIRRKSRPGGLTSLTYITAYLNLNGEDMLPQDSIESDDGDQVAGSEVNNSQPGREQSTAPVDDAGSSAVVRVASAHSALFFGSRAEISSDRAERSRLIPRSVKTHEVKRGGGSRQPDTEPTASSPETVELLKNEGVLCETLLRDLQTKPLAELEAIRTYLDRQTNVQNRPGLFVWLLQRDFGAQLLNQPTPSCAPALGSRSRRRQRGSAGQPLEITARHYPDAELEGQWRKVLLQLHGILHDDEFTTWIEPITLIAIQDDQAIIATPNVFVRDEVQRLYLPQLEAALRAVYGRQMRLQVVVDCMPTGRIELSE